MKQMSLSCKENISKLWHLKGGTKAQRLLKNEGVDENKTNPQGGMMVRISGTNGL
jgi:hypothetical protein